MMISVNGNGAIRVREMFPYGGIGCQILFSSTSFLRPVHAARPTQGTGLAVLRNNRAGAEVGEAQKSGTLLHCSTAPICTRRDIDSLSEEYTSVCVRNQIVTPTLIPT